ncbi:peptidylprolyl isomerase [Synechococcus sp. LA31]|uniref:peptidylprolyl isomerase n=1 Tax=Synechococcus sp. LA31 TaxID=2741953 RepID=UPI001BDCD29A|nr:peptidylprolyl isomerase [Synechococcus sp. LA31]QVV67049.1 peptidylprolyl isomerase [Synechococcus sp. LA31]
MQTPSAETLQPEALALLRRHNLLAPLIRAEVVAGAVGAIQLEPQQTEELLQNHCERQGLENEAELSAYLQQLQLSQADLLWQLELPLRVQHHCQHHFHHKAEARFLARKEQLDRVVYSLLRVKDPFLARELYLQIAGGEANFADLAAEFAEGPERGTKGIVGPVPLTQAHPALAERLRTTTAGQLMEPFQIADWWLVTRLERYEPARFNEAIAEQMAQELFQEWVQEQVTAKLARLPHHLSDTSPA